LSTPDEAECDSLPLERAEGYSALRLFAERARAARSDFSLDEDNLPAAAAICARLDGLPLAIELIAARLRLMSPQSLLERLDEDLALRADGMRARPARQKTLHNAISWSYDRLSGDEQRAFAWLSVFAGGFTLQTAEEVLSDAAKPLPVADILASLLDKSLLQSSVDPSGEPRMYLLATLQQYAAERLREIDEQDRARQRHLEYFRELADTAQDEIYGPRQAEWIQRLDGEHDNFQAALEWCAASHQPEAALHLLSALGWAWSVRARASEMRGWFDQISRLPGARRHAALYARVLNHLGKQHWLSGEFQSAQAVLEESERIWKELGAEGEIGLAEAWDRLGLAARWGDGDNESARRLFEQSHRLYQQCGDQRGTAESLFHLAILENDAHRRDAALRMYSRSLELFEALGDLWGTARVSQLLGQFYLDQENFDRARRYFDQHLRIDQRLQFIEGIVVALRNLGNLYRYQGEQARAEAYYQESLALCREHALKDDLSKNLYCLGLLALQRRQYRQAQSIFRDCFHTARSVNEKKAACDVLFGSAAAAAGDQQAERAAKLFGAAQAALEVIDLPYSPYDCAEFDRHLQLARKHLGKAAFDALMNEGCRMMPDQAVAYALIVEG